MKKMMIALLLLSLGACAEGDKGADHPAAVASAEAPAPRENQPVDAPPTEAPAARGAPSAAAPKAAIFLVGEELTPQKIQALGAALAGLDGVLAAKPDGAAGTFVVTFTPGQVTPELLGARLVKAAPGAEFMGLTAPTEIPANHDDCGACPYKDKCAGAH